MQPLAHRETFLDEVECLARVDGEPGIMNVVNVYETGGMPLTIVSDLYDGGDLFDYIADHAEVGNTVPVPEALEFCHQMLTAVETCHKAGFAHLDLKPENFVFRNPPSGGGERRELMLIDFGASEPFVKAPYAATMADYVVGMEDELTLKKVAGTACYVPPEVLRGSFSSRSDVWSIGVTLYMMLVGTRPFESAKPDGILAEHSVKRQVLGSIEPEAMDRMRRAAEAKLDSPAVMRLLFKLLEPDSILRCSATEALQCMAETAEEISVPLTSTTEAPTLASTEAPLLQQCM